jgi:hypothetical protein
MNGSVISINCTIEGNKETTNAVMIEYMNEANNE